MARKVAVVAALLAAAAIVWATRWVALWELSLALHPPRSQSLTEEALHPRDVDWRAHLALGYRSRAPKGADESKWRSEHLEQAGRLAPREARGAAYTVMLVEVNRKYSFASDMPPEGLARTEEIGLRARSADPDNGHCEAVLAFMAFAGGQRDEAARYLLSASRKPWRRYDRQVAEAVRYLAWRAGLSPTRDPLYAYSSDICTMIFDAPPPSRLASYAKDTALAYGRSGRLREAEGLAKAMIALGERMQRGAFSAIEWLQGRHFTMMGFEALQELGIRYRGPDEALAVCREFQKSSTSSARASEVLRRTLDPFMDRLVSWALRMPAIAYASVGVIRFLPILLAFLAVARWYGGPSPTRGFLSLVRLVPLLCVALAPPVLLFAGTVPKDVFYSPGPPPPELELAFLWTLALLLAVPVASLLDLRERGRMALAALAGLALSAGVAAVLVLVVQLGYPRPELAETAALVVTAAAAFSLGVWMFRLLRTPPAGEPAGAAQPMATAWSWREMAGRLYWLSLRTFAACVGLVLAGLLFHLFFLIWIGPTASYVVQHGEASLLRILKPYP